LRHWTNPAEQCDPPRAIGIERPHGHLVDAFRTLVIALVRETLRKTARPEPIDQNGEIALLSPQMAPFLMPLRKR
jgi:hypothetical protein